jgi:N-acetylneuraminic acid mutarotase
MKTPKTTHNMKRNFIWILTSLMLSGLLGMASISLAAGDAWTRKADMPTARYALSTSTVNGIIYAIGGATGRHFNAVLPTVEAYNPVTETWTTKADMPTARAFHAASVVDGIIYTIGGSRVPLEGLPTVEAYDPVTDTWAKKADMPTARFALSTSVVNGQIYAIGGAQDSGWIELSTVEVYDPVTDTWTAKTDMPTARCLLGTSVLEGQIYAIGGYNGRGAASNGMSTVEAYDPVTDNWASKADMPTGRLVLSTSAVDGIIYAISGAPEPGDNSGFPGVSTVEAYNAVTNTWATKTDIPTPRGRLSTSVANGRIYAIGGSKFWYGAGGSGEDYPTVEEYTPEGWQTTAVSPQGKLTATWGEIKRSR